MLEKGLIVSIQGYSFSTTQELAEHAIKGGAVAIRTDKPLEIEVPMIGLMKFKKKKFYITTSIKTIENVSFSTNYVAIDSREGNKDICDLYSFCKIHSIDIVADIGRIEDVEYLINFGCVPDYICTTFSFLYNDGYPDIQLIERIQKLIDVPIIAEGGFEHLYQIQQAMAAGANNVCIGKAISKVYEKTEEYVNMFKEYK